MSRETSIALPLLKTRKVGVANLFSVNFLSSTSYSLTTNKQEGSNFLSFYENNAGTLSNMAGGVAMALGQPELAAPILSAGNSVQKFGGNIKNLGNKVQGGIHMGAMKGNQIANQLANQVTNQGMSALGQARQQINQAGNNINNQLSNLPVTLH